MVRARASADHSDFCDQRLCKAQNMRIDFEIVGRKLGKEEPFVERMGGGFCKRAGGGKIAPRISFAS